MLCPHCHEESFAKKKLQRDGWNITGEVEVCALCGKIWHEKHGKKSGTPENSAEDERRRRLSALLGGEEPGKIKLAGETDRRFCRNCKHFIVHPFRNFCALSDKDTDPMGECSSFSERPQA
ncbi:MAG: hypothetical protein IKA71_08040 [Lentisphaeria bacterium]|nr:hypothetical protein [Lentisphaeria bacterium]